mmetsp:Transcript_97207/g.190913  ORF Transcript_97207/g.190913 Transcript_97207/m.190913 type:complete len:290 (-) Transcript_97207:325-1194(-)
MCVGTKLLDPVVLHALEVTLPRLVVLREIRERDHLSVEPQTRGHRLQHRGIQNVDEAELARQVPHELLVAQALQLDVAEVIHGREGFRRLHEVSRGEGVRRLCEPEAVVHLVTLCSDEARHGCDGGPGHGLRQRQALGVLQPIVDLHADDLDGRGAVAPRRLAPRHATLPIVHDHLVHLVRVICLDIFGHAKLALEVRVHTVVCLLRVDSHHGLLRVVDVIDEELAIPRGPGARAPFKHDVSGHVGLGILLDELPELLGVPCFDPLLHDVHLEAVAVLELELDAQDDAV